MPPHNALAANGARSGATSAGGNARRRQDSLANTLAELSDRLDGLQRDVSLGTRSWREHERNIDEAEAIANELRAAFRSPTAAQNPPLWKKGGRAIW